ncbi:hypothetical protein FRB94_012577 [Tulasnella sp. JGI-2019a]|nr:hypothetical protein FRB93_001460 [Tulasnella sp. JGI-2019a]KAG9009053.1 hypothetical protein FRB94_012577 [Tulasnella sp. JGI-2019a]
MDRADSSLSPASPPAFAYQTRLLERTNSISRSSSVSKSGSPPGIPPGILSPTTGTRRWTPSHRVANSMDSVRGRWEEKIKAADSENAQSGDGRGIAVSGSGASLVSPSSSRSSGLSADADEPYFRVPTTPARVPRYRLWDEPPPSQSSTSTSVSDSVSPPSITPAPTAPAAVTHKRNTLPSFFPPPPAEPPHPSSQRSPSPASLNSLPTSTSNPSILSASVVRRSYAPLNDTTGRTPTPKTPALMKRLSGQGTPWNAPADTAKPSYPSTVRARRANSVDVLRSSHTGTSNDSSSASSVHSTTEVASLRSYRRSPSPASTTAPTTPTSFRSSNMGTKQRSGMYPTTLGHAGGGRKFGRHMPRIASGDGDEDWEEEKRKEEEKEEQEARARIAARERARQKLEGLRFESPTASLPSVPPIRPQSPQSPTSPQDPSDVAGIPGRLRLSRETRLPPVATKPTSKYTVGLWVDVQRHLLQAYEYLCHVGEAQQWIEGCLQEELPFGVVEMDEGLRNGVVLAKLARIWEGETLVKRIFEHPKLQYKHSDNVNYFFVFVRRQGLPESFIFELTDLYNKKNIPKVIYCIHALSHLLARKGMAERIGNLVGQLQFSNDQLQQTQKGLTGVSMPNFKGVGKDLAKDMNVEPEPEPEPVETEYERRGRLLMESEPSIIQLQAQARGFLIRTRLATQRARLRLAERHLIKLQSRCRGKLTRQNLQEQRKEQMNLEPWVLALQAAARGILARRAWQARLARMRYATRFVIKVQAQARGVIERRKWNRIRGALRSSKVSVVKLQALARARIRRNVHQEVMKSLEVPIVMSSVVGLQAAARGALVRKRIRKQLTEFWDVEGSVRDLQAHVRGVIVRRRVRAQLAKLDDAADVVIRIQAACRSWLARQRLLALIRGLRKATPGLIGLQARGRAVIARRRREQIERSLADVRVSKTVGNLQAVARAAIIRRRVEEQLKRLEVTIPDVTGLQALARGFLVREAFWAWREYLHSSQVEATHLQALMRGLLQRRRFREKMAFFRANMDKVVKIQSIYRAREQREQYRQLTMGTNVTVGTIKNFVHLLDDSEADFEDEIEVERLRKKVVEGIRENQQLETDVSELDVKIALVVQNVKSFEELMKARRRHGADSAAIHASRASVLAAHGDPFAGPNATDQATKRKLELYQQLFYLLQTHGDYIARLFYALSRTQTVSAKIKKTAERVVLTLFGYGQDRREEYLFLKLFQAAIHEEIKPAPTIIDIINGHPMYVAVAAQFVRPKQISYVREALSVLINQVISQVDLDLETDPVKIYRARLNEEELRTGRPSLRPKDVDFHEAVNDPETRVAFIQNLQKLQFFTKDFVNAITTSTRKMPYAMRCIARELVLALRIKFPDEPEEMHAVALGQVIYYRFLNPAIVTPETFDIVPTTISAAARRNLAEISKMLTQIASGVPFTEDNPCLTPLNNYVSEAIKIVSTWLIEVADVPDAEAQLHANEFLDATVEPKPIYISPNEVYVMHSLLASQIDHLVDSRDDVLRTILTELGGAPNLGTDELKDARDRGITLNLTNRFVHVQDPHADEKALWVQAKRGILAILRVQPARDLVESLMQPVTDEHELLWEDIVDKELVTERMRLRKARMPSTGGRDAAYRLEDIRALSFRDVKGHAMYFLLELEKQGKVTRADGYQGILNAIASDVRSKHWKRVQRKQELDDMGEAITHLKERKKNFVEQIDSYESYVETAMATMQRGKGKKRFVMPFTKQWGHIRDLQKHGKAPQYGSFKYSAQDLYDKGILLSIDQTSPRQFDKIDLVLSSNKAGVFTIEVTDSNMNVMMGLTDLKMEDLLQAQFENRVSLSLFDGLAKFNLNLLLYQINKKFYV